VGKGALEGGFEDEGRFNCGENDPFTRQRGTNLVKIQGREGTVGDELCGLSFLLMLLSEKPLTFDLGDLLNWGKESGG